MCFIFCFCFWFFGFALRGLLLYVMSESSTNKMYIHKLIAITFHSSCHYVRCVCAERDVDIMCAEVFTVLFWHIACIAYCIPSHPIGIIHRHKNNNDKTKKRSDTWTQSESFYKTLWWCPIHISFDWWLCFNGPSFAACCSICGNVRKTVALNCKHDQTYENCWHFNHTHPGHTCNSLPCSHRYYAAKSVYSTIFTIAIACFIYVNHFSFTYFTHIRFGI